jgi:hypothetical protein
MAIGGASQIATSFIGDVTSILGTKDAAGTTSPAAVDVSAGGGTDARP